MQWVITAFVLCSVSLLVVSLTMEQNGEALHHRGGITVSRGVSLLLRLLFAARALAITTGHRLRSGGEAAGKRAMAVAFVSARSIGTTVQTRLRPHARRLVAPTPVRDRPRRAPRFEECLQVTAPETGVSSALSRGALSLAPVPAGSWIQRVLSLLALVVAVAAAGGAIALALFAVGWKVARVF
jgi:hypothetical protein